MISTRFLAAVNTFACLQFEKLRSCAIFLFEDAPHLVSIEFDFEVGCLEELHIRELVTSVRYKLLLHAPQLIFLLFEHGQFVKEALPSTLVEFRDLIEAVGDVLDYLMKLVDVDLQDDSFGADAFGGIGVLTHPRDVLQAEHVARADDHDLLAHILLCL